MTKRWTQAIQGRDEQRLMKRQAVLIVGARLFHEQGYERTSLDDIAKALGVTKPSLYYYIKNKDEILFEVISHSLGVTGQAFELAKSQAGDGLERLLFFFRAYALHMHDDYGRCAASVEIQSLDAALQIRIKDARKVIDAQVRQLVIEGRNDGSVADLDPRWASFFLFGAFNWIAHWQKANGPANADDIAEAFVALAARTLAVR